MAEFKFSDADFKAEAARTKAKAKTARTAMLSGMAASLDQLSDEGRSALELQRALGRGAVRSQATELQRLIEKHGAGHPYVLAAEARGATLDGLTSDMGELTQRAGHLFETFGERSVFHGYVFSAGGSAAPGLIVELRLTLKDQSARPPARAIPRFQSTTDEDGYFRMNLAQPEDAPNEQKKGAWAQKSPGTKPEKAAEGSVSGLAASIRNMKEMGVENLIRTPIDREAAVEEKPGPTQAVDEKGSTDSTTGGEHPTVVFRSEVRILDGRETGKVLYTDLTPPEFQARVSDGTVELQSQFRLYSLP